MIAGIMVADWLYILRSESLSSEFEYVAEYSLTGLTRLRTISTHRQ